MINLRLHYDTQLFGHPCIPSRHRGLSEKRKEGKWKAMTDTRKTQINERSKKLRVQGETIERKETEIRRQVGWIFKLVTGGAVSKTVPRKPLALLHYHSLVR